MELLGRTQRQEQDMAWYTCINHVKVLGKPLHNFIPAPALQQRQAAGGGPPLVLATVREDPMLARGGLMALSEGGLLSQRLAIEEHGAPPLAHHEDGHRLCGDCLQGRFWMSHTWS